MADVLARIPLPHPDSQSPSSSQVAVAGGALWVADARGEYLVRIELESNTVTSVVSTDTAYLVVGDGRLWSIGPLSGAGGPPPSTITLSRVDLASGTIDEAQEIPRGSVAAGLGAVWLLRTSPMYTVDGDISATLTKFSPETIEANSTWKTQGQSLFIACGWLWAFGYSESGSFMERIDSRTGASTPVGTLPLLIDTIPAMTGTASSCWLVSRYGAQAMVGGELTDPIAAPTGQTMVVVDEAIWVTAPGGLIGRFDPATAAIGQQWVLPAQDLLMNAKGQPDWLLASAGGSLWLLNRNEAVRYNVPA